MDSSTATQDVSALESRMSLLTNADAHCNMGTPDLSKAELGELQGLWPQDSLVPPCLMKAQSTSPPSDCCSSGNGSSSSISGNVDICRICHESGREEALLSPCHCSGSVKHVHQTCLQRWLQGSGCGSPDARRCELCGYDFVMTSRVKPFRQWQKLKMSPVERRKVLCSVTFHIVAITCVVWSLYVLIDRTTQEIQEGNLQWPFWTKLVVVAIGFTGGLVFMYVQCKMYLQLFRKWKAHNRVIQIQSFCELAEKAEKVAPPTPLLSKAPVVLVAMLPPGVDPHRSDISGVT